MKNAFVALVAISMMTVALPAEANNPVQTGSGTALGPLSSGPFSPGPLTQSPVRGITNQCTVVETDPGTAFILVSPDGGDWDIFFNGKARRAYVTPGDEAGLVPEDATFGTVCPYSAAGADSPAEQTDAFAFTVGDTSFVYQDEVNPNKQE